MNREIMSNFDHRINRLVAEMARLDESEQLYDYPAWNFHGYVRKVPGGWTCEIWQYGVMLATIAGETLEEIMRQACEKYGDG